MDVVRIVIRSLVGGSLCVLSGCISSGVPGMGYQLPNLSADLNAQIQSVSPSRAKPGQQVKVVASIYHCCDVKENVELRLELDDSFVDSETFMPSDDRGNKIIEFNLVAPSASGSHFLKIIVDPRNLVTTERFEYNNTATASLDVES